MSRRPGDDIQITSQEMEWGKYLSVASGGDCPAGEVIVQFVDSKLSKQGRDEVLGHLGHCRACRAAILELRAERRAANEQRPYLLQNWGRIAIGAFAVASLLIAGYGAFLRTATVHPANGEVASRVQRGTREVASIERSKAELRSNPVAFAAPSRLPIAAKPIKPKRQDEWIASNVGSGSSESGVRAMKLCLVLGASHVYKVDEKDEHRDQRKHIEQTFADGIAEKRDKYSHSLRAGKRHVEADAELNRELDQLKEDREHRLAELYPVADELKVAHPELRVENCGPCPVIEVNVRADGVPDPAEDFVVVEPWPGYKSKEAAYGWTYGRHYSPDEFQQEHVQWQETHLGSGRPAYYGLEGANGPVAAEAIRRTRSGAFRVHVPSRANSVSANRTSTSRYSSDSRRTTAVSSFTPEQNRADGGSTARSKYSHSSSEPTEASSRNFRFGQRTLADQPQPSRYSHTLSGSHYPPNYLKPEPKEERPAKSKYSRTQPRG